MLKVSLFLVIFSVVYSMPLEDKDLLDNLGKAFKDCSLPNINEKIYREQLKTQKLDEDSKKYNLCLYETTGIMDDKGKVDQATMKRILELVLPDKAAAIMEKCVNNMGSDPLDTATKITVCGTEVIYG